MKIISIFAILTAAIFCDASEYKCRPVNSGRAERLTIDTQAGRASVFNGKYWTVLKQADLRVKKSIFPEPIYRFEGEDVFRNVSLTLYFNEFRLIAEINDGSFSSTNYQCVD